MSDTLQMEQAFTSVYTPSNVLLHALVFRLKYFTEKRHVRDGYRRMQRAEHETTVRAEGNITMMDHNVAALSSNSQYFDG